MSKKILFIISFFWLPLQGQSLYQIDAIPFNARVSIINSDGTEIQTGLSEDKLKSTRSDVYYHWFKKDTVYQTMGGYGGKLLHGSYIELFPDRALKTSGTHRMGKKHGQWQYWNNSGTIRMRSVWRNGKESGAFSIYDESGKLLQHGRKKDGLLHGTLRTYHYTDTGFTTVSTRYKKGVISERPRFRDRILGLAGVAFFNKPKHRQ